MFMITAETGAAVTSPTVEVGVRVRKEYRIVQASVTAAGNIVIEGRTDPAMPWVTAHTFTASGAVSLALFKEMRAVLTGNTGTVDVFIDDYA